MKQEELMYTAILCKINESLDERHKVKTNPKQKEEKTYKYNNSNQKDRT